MKEKLLRKIRERDACIGIVGLGRVGLTTASIFANAGFCVIGSDVKKDVVDLVLSGRSHIKEPKLDGLVKKAVRKGKLRPTTDTLEAAKEADIEMICVQTPLTNENKSDPTPIEKACESIVAGLSKGKLVIVESTVSPGTTKNKIAKILESGSRLKCGEDFWLAHCPERIAVGRAVQDFMANTRIIGGYDINSAMIAAELFRTVTKGEIIMTDCTSAEVAKLAENAYRYVNIAFANELALACEHICVDITEAIKLANTHPRVNIHEPGCGVGGPCLPKDTYMLLRSAREEGFKSKIIESSRKINEYMPEHTVKLLIKAQRESGKRIQQVNATVLGSAYRGEIDDARNSPAEEIVRKLMNLGVNVTVYDPYSDESFGARRAKDIFKAAKGADYLIIVTDHEMFKELNLKTMKSLMNENPTIIDGRRVLDAKKAAKYGFKYVGIGYCARRIQK